MEITERYNAAFQGIVEVGRQTENAIKHRINAGDEANDANDKTVASIQLIAFINKFQQVTIKTLKSKQ